ncbi:MAG TPA: tetratricopeptide repeat protein [Candidatus Polarisedimenticolia bacterium]|nr:tetratricopeptide repeat protein [Candidatus Polarisedimenticolia bacterium]
MRRGPLLLAAAVLAAILLACVTYVPRGQLAVRESYGGSAVALRPGLHLRVPLLQRLYRYQDAPLAIDEAMPITTRDNAAFKLPIRITVRPASGDLLTFHNSRSGREPRTYMLEQVRQAVGTAAKGMGADELLVGDAGVRLGPVVSADLITRGISDDGLVVGRPGPQVLLNAVIDYLNRKLPASARRLAEQAVAQDPHEALYKTALGMVLEAEGKRPQAEAAYLDALYLDPASSPPMSRLFVLELAHRDQASLSKLRRLLEASIEKDPSSAVHHDWLGQVYMRLGRTDDAEKSFHTAIGLAPKEPEYRISLGALKVEEHKMDEAKAAYEEALKISPDHPLALYNLGVIEAMGGKLDQALDFFHRAERAGTPSVALFNALAQAYEEQGHLDRAAEYLRRSLALRPDQPDRRAALRRLEARLKTKS